MSSPLYGPAPMNDRKSIKESTAVGEFGSVLRKNWSRDENVVPPNPPGAGGGRKNTPSRKILNEMKNENNSKFAPTLNTCFHWNRLTLSVNCHTSWFRML